MSTAEIVTAWVAPQMRGQAIMEQTAADHGITVAQLRSHDRRRKVSWARFDCMVRLYAERDEWQRYSTTRIGLMLGGLDHSTVVYGMKRWPVVRPRWEKTQAEKKGNI